MTTINRGIYISVVTILAVTLVSCDDPKKQAMKIFTDQGLVVLQPARDYVKPGGLVVLSSGGRPDYVDPLDDLGTDSSNEVNFSAIIQGQKEQTSTGLDVALGLIGQIIKVPVGLKFGTGQTVQLDQVDASGQRLVTPKVQSLLQKKTTSDFLKRQLIAKNRAFVVQEIYSAKSLSLKTTSNNALDVSYGSGGSLANCSTNSTGKSAMSNTDKGSQTTAKSGPSTAASEGQKSTTSSSQVISVGACRNTQFEFTLQSAKEIPFAVRLFEVVLDNVGDLHIKYGGFKFPKSLGSSEVEKQTAFLDSDNSPLMGLSYTPRSE